MNQPQSTRSSPCRYKCGLPTYRSWLRSKQPPPAHRWQLATSMSRNSYVQFTLFRFAAPCPASPQRHSLTPLDIVQPEHGSVGLSWQGRSTVGNNLSPNDCCQLLETTGGSPSIDRYNLTPTVTTRHSRTHRDSGSTALLDLLDRRQSTPQHTQQNKDSRLCAMEQGGYWQSAQAAS